MAEPKRRSSYRQLQAQMTKDRIIAAARKLMAERGWTATTVEAIANEAGVATPTVYAAFGSKRSIVEAMRHAMRRDSQIPELMERARAAPDPATRLTLWARLIRRQMETSYDVISIHRQAARADAAFAAEYRKVLDGRARTLAAFIEDLRGDLAPGVTHRTATDVLWALSNEELYRELVEERGWSPDHFEHWLARTLIAQLIEDPAVAAPSPHPEARPPRTTG